MQNINTLWVQTYSNMFKLILFSSMTGFIEKNFFCWPVFYLETTGKFQEGYIIDIWMAIKLENWWVTQRLLHLLSWIDTLDLPGLRENPALSRSSQIQHWQRPKYQQASSCFQQYSTVSFITKVAWPSLYVKILFHNKSSMFITLCKIIGRKHRHVVSETAS